MPRDPALGSFFWQSLSGEQWRVQGQTDKNNPPYTHNGRLELRVVHRGRLAVCTSHRPLWKNKKLRPG